MSTIVTRLTAAALFAFGAGALASPLCLPGTLQDYIDLAGGCEIGSTTFANFFLAPGQAAATPINPSLIQVTPGGSASSPALLFTLNATALGADLFESFFHFSVSAGLGVSLTGAGATMGGASATGNGVALLVENLCLGGVYAGVEPILCSGVDDALIAFATALDADTDVSTAFAGVAFIDVFADLTADGGLSGTATLGNGLLSFATSAPPPVPEPPTLPLAAAALAALAPFARRAPLHPRR